MAAGLHDLHVVVQHGVEVVLDYSLLVEHGGDAELAQVLEQAVTAESHGLSVQRVEVVCVDLVPDQADVLPA